MVAVQQLVDIYISNVQYSIIQGNNEISKLSQPELDNLGFCGRSYRHFFNNLMDAAFEAVYLEVGVYYGGTFSLQSRTIM